MIGKLSNRVIGLVLMAWLLVVFLPSRAEAQGTLMQLPPLTTSLGQPIAGATISVFTTTGNLPNLVCAAPVTVYKDVALTIPFTTLTTDGAGNYPFFIQPSSNPYGFTVSGSGTTTSQCYGFSAPIPPLSSPTFIGITTGTLNVTGLSTLATVNEGATSATTGDFSGRLNANGNGAAGNVALKYPSADHVIYVSPNGSDANDGLSMGTAKLTPQAAFNAATTSGTVSGTVILAPGGYACPTTWYSNMEVHSLSRQYPFSYVLSWGFVTTQSGAVFNCTSGSNVTIGPDVTNLFLDGVAINFSNSGGGFVLNSVSASRFEHVSIQLAGNSTQDAVQLKVNASTGVTHNTALNVFDDFAILCNTAGVGTQANGLTLTGQGAVNSGVDVTDNRFTNLSISGGIKNGIVFGLNTDSNYLSAVQINNTGTAQGDVLVFNSATPGSDQDADAITLLGVVSTGSFSHTISMGQASGDHIQISSAAEVTPNVLGGTPTYIVETVGLGGQVSSLNVNGTIRGTLKAPNNTSPITGRDVGNTVDIGMIKIGVDNLVHITGTGDMSVQAATDTLVARNTTDTLTHKAMNGAASGNAVVLLSSLKQDATAQLTGNAADQTIWTFSIPGNTIESGKGIDFDIWVSHDVGTASITWKITYGSAVVSCAIGGTSVNEIHFRGMIANNNSVTNAQRLGLDCTTTNAESIGTATGAVDTTASQTLTFSFNVANTDKITGHSLRPLKF